MPTIGGYETVRELASDALGVVYSARRAGDTGEPRYAVKVRRARRFADEGEGEAGSTGKVANPRLAALLESAEVQKRLAAAGPIAAAETNGARKDADARSEGNWLAIHESGVLPDGSAYVVTDLAPLGSFVRLARGRVTLNTLLLARLIGGVIAGLETAERAGKRGHGNLKAANVLLMGGPDLSAARVALSDPAPDGRADFESQRLADLRGVGELIVLLVTHEAKRGGWPVESSALWSRLGRSGAKWLELANRLLDPHDKAERPSLDGLAQTVAALGRERDKRKPLIMAGAAGAAVLLLVLVSFMVFGGSRKGITDLKRTKWTAATAETYAKAWADYCAEHEWFEGIRANLKKPIKRPWAGSKPRAEVYAENGLDIAGVAKQIEDGGLEPFTIDGTSASRRWEQRAESGPENAKVVSDEGVDRTEKGLALIGDVRAQLTDRWPVRVRIADGARDFKERGWGGLSDRLNEVTAALEPSPSAAMVESIDRAIGVDRRLAPIRSTIAEVESIGKALAGAEDRVPAAFGHAASGLVAARLVGAASPDSEALADALGQALETVKGLGARLAETVGRENVDYESMHESQEYATLAESVQSGKIASEVFDGWLKLAAEFPTLDPALDPRRGWKGDEQLAEIERLVAALALPPVTVALEPADATRLEQARGETGTLFGAAKLKWNKRNQQQVMERDTALRGTLSALKSAADAKTAVRTELIRTGREGVLAALGQPVRLGPGLAGVEAAVDSWRAALRSRVNNDNFMEIKGKADAIDAAVREAVGGFGGEGAQAAAGGWESALTGVVAGKVGEQLAQAFRALPVPPEADAVRSAAETATRAHKDFSEGVTALAGDLRTVEGAFALGYVLSGESAEARAGSQALGQATKRPVYSDTDVKQAVRPVVERAEAGRAIATQGDGEALARLIAATRTAAPEQALAALARLTQIGGWPSNDVQLRVAGALRQPCVEAAGTIKDAARRQAALASIDTAMVKLWTTFAAGATTKEAMDAAIAQVASFGVTDAQIEPRLRYNLLLSRLRADLGQGQVPDERVSTVLTGFVQSVGGLGVSTDQRARRLETELKRIAENREPPFDPQQTGPGLVGWAAKSVTADDRIVSYTRGNATLEFVRVEGSTPQENAYLGVTEVSLGQFGEIIDAAGGDWTLVLSIIEAPAEDTVPRGWVVQGGRLRPAPDWVVPQPALPSTFGPGVTVEPPSNDHPIQCVSLKAAVYAASLVGCRLPTPQEWGRARAAGGNGAAPAPVVRGDAFIKQMDYLMSPTAARANEDMRPWPDTGIYAYDGSKRGPAKREVSGNRQGTLFFSKVSLGGGEPPLHLVGNVAEFVCSTPAAFKAGGKPSAGDLDAFIRGAADSVRVIGGSSLSPSTLAPETEFDPVGGVDIPIGWSDVGFRLAFSATGRKSLVAQAREELAKAEYLLAGAGGAKP